MNHNGRERGILCQRKSLGDHVGGTRIPLPVVFRRSQVERRINPATIAEDTPLHTTCSRKLFNQNYGADSPVSETHAVSSSINTETLSHKDDDLDSVRSYGSVCSTMSCDHAYFARNGTTFSGRHKKYVVHCSTYSGETEEYLTPTQRANKQIRRLKMQLSEAKQELEKKDQEIFNLMKEVMELRLYKAALSGPEDILGPSEHLISAQDAGAKHEGFLGQDETVQPIHENGEGYSNDSQSSASRQENVQASPAIVHIGKTVVDLPSSLTDSGHFEESGSSPSILLSDAKEELEQKDQDIFHLKAKVMDLQLHKATSSGPEKIKGLSENVNGAKDTDDEQKYSFTKGERVKAICVNSESCSEDLQGSSSRKENVRTSPALLHGRKRAVDLPSSLTDSGLFEETASSSSANSKDSASLQHTIKDHASGIVLEDRESERARIVHMWEKKLDELQRKHVNECQEHNEKVQNLLQSLTDAKERYYELRSDYEKAQDKIRELENDTESLRKSLEEQEERHKSMYLKMYMKGQEAARFEHADQVLEFAHIAPSRVSVPELLQQLQITENELENIKERDEQQRDNSETALLSAKEAISLWILGTRKAMYRKIVETRSGKNEMDPVITLQFLKSAIYHFLTDKENYQGHLNAIENILGYSENERLNIQKAYRSHAKK